MQLELKNDIRQLLSSGGEIACAGVNIESNGKKYYEFSINYFKISLTRLSVGEDRSGEFAKEVYF